MLHIVLVHKMSDRRKSRKDNWTS